MTPSSHTTFAKVYISCFNDVVQLSTPTRRTSSFIRLCVIAEPEWNDWSSWGACTESCGKGTQTRTRQCIQPDLTVVDAALCNGESSEIRDCVCDWIFSADGMNANYHDRCI